MAEDKAPEQVRDDTADFMAPTPLPMAISPKDDEDDDNIEVIPMNEEGHHAHRRPLPSRFPEWYALTVFSAIALIALVTETDSNLWQAEEKWVLSVTVISMVVGCLACVAHIGWSKAFVGMPLEGFALFTELGVWMGGLLAMMDTDNLLAVDGNGRILNSNLYFFSWLSLGLTVHLFVGYGRHANSETVAEQNSQSRGYWTGIALASSVVAVSSIQAFLKGVTIQGRDLVCSKDGSGDYGSNFCQRIKLAIGFGIFGTVTACGCSLFSPKLPTFVYGLFSFSMLLCWALGVAFCTFGGRSPGKIVANLYFASWTAFILSLFVVSTLFNNFLQHKEEQECRSDRDTPNDNSETGRIGIAPVSVRQLSPTTIDGNSKSSTLVLSSPPRGEATQPKLLVGHSENAV